MKFQVYDWRSFEEFAGLGVMNTIPDATTIAFFSKRLRKAGVTDDLVERFEEHMRSQGLEARGGPIIDATLVPVPKQRDSRPENESIKRGLLPNCWANKPERLRQKDYDARWVNKNGISYYGYKNSICIDASHGLIRRYVSTPDNTHDSQLCSQGLDLENRDDFVWADSGYAGARYEDLLEIAGGESRIHEKRTRCNHLSEEAKERTKVGSRVRTRFEHVIGVVTTTMRGKLTRRIGMARTKASWGLSNMTYNFLHYQHCSSRLALSA